MKTIRINISMPVTLKAKLDAERRHGTTTGGRSLLYSRRSSFDTLSDPIHDSQPLCFRCFPPLVSRVYRITLALPHC